MKNARKSNQYLVTGATSDIGRELLRALDADPANRLLAVSRKVLDPAEAGLSARHTYLSGIDLTDENQLQQLSAAAENCFDQPFTVIHSVGDFWEHKELIDTPFAEARRMYESHYLTLFGVAQVVLPLQKRLGGGRLIAFSCNSVSYNYPEMAAFTSAKAAVETLIKCIANENSQHKDVYKRQLQRPIRYTNPSVFQFIGRQLRAGRKLDYALVVTALYTMTRFGNAREVTDDVQTILGRSPISFDRFVDDYRTVWQAL